jgi:hypothetical protein
LPDPELKEKNHSKKHQNHATDKQGNCNDCNRCVEKNLGWPPTKKSKGLPSIFKIKIKQWREEGILEFVWQMFQDLLRFILEHFESEGNPPPSVAWPL